MLKLPELIKLEDYNGNWENYLEAIYQCFLEDFFRNGIKCDYKKVACIKEPKYRGKEFAFWHLISEGESEEERIPDMERCKRIKWPKVIVENCSDEKVHVWKTVRRRKNRSNQKRIIFCYDWIYAVVLTERKGYYLFCTAYPLANIRAKKFKKEYEKYINNAKTAP
jgi:hypothetical protein